MTILFTCAGRRNYLIHYFKKLIGKGGRTIAVDSDATAPALTDADIALTVPSLFEASYIATLIGIIKKHKVDLIIPLNDIELPIMAANKEKLEAYGAKVIVSRPDLIDLGADKWKTYHFFRDLKIPTARSFTKVDDALLALAENSVKFPLILKPRWGFGSVGIQEAGTEEELRLAYQLLLAKGKKSLTASVSVDDSESQVIIQEKLDGDEYGIDILNDFEGNYYGAFVKKKLAMRAGETDKAMSVVDSRFNKLAERIAGATRHVGIMDCDFFARNGEVYFLEMNPRFGGGYPFSHEAGVNIPAMYLEWLKGNTDISRYDNYQSGMTFSKCERIVKVGEYKTAGKEKVRLTV